MADFTIIKVLPEKEGQLFECAESCGYKAVTDESNFIIALNSDNPDPSESDWMITDAGELVCFLMCPVCNGPLIMEDKN